MTFFDLLYHHFGIIYLDESKTPSLTDAHFPFLCQIFKTDYETLFRKSQEPIYGGSISNDPLFAYSIGLISEKYNKQTEVYFRRTFKNYFGAKEFHGLSVCEYQLGTSSLCGILSLMFEEYYYLRKFKLTSRVKFDEQLRWFKQQVSKWQNGGEIVLGYDNPFNSYNFGDGVALTCTLESILFIVYHELSHIYFPKSDITFIDEYVADIQSILFLEDLRYLTPYAPHIADCGPFLVLLACSLYDPINIQFKDHPPIKDRYSVLQGYIQNMRYYPGREEEYSKYENDFIMDFCSEIFGVLEDRDRFYEFHGVGEGIHAYLNAVKRVNDHESSVQHKTYEDIYNSMKLVDVDTEFDKKVAPHFILNI